MTDGSIIYSSGGGETKAFNVKDGHGIKLFKKAGLDVAIITARTSEVVERRAADLGVKLLYQGATDKLVVFKEILEIKSLDPSETAYIGDDVIDLPVLKRVGLSATVADAVEEVLSSVDYVATLSGGRGAVREVVELILKSQGLWDGLMKRYRA
ncbi:MAG: HAD hydrolase family protein [Proteobacteria bacterium]|nr:HAD hydrolase family protein [Pseudomonadota bacterium]